MIKMFSSIKIHLLQCYKQDVPVYVSGLNNYFQHASRVFSFFLTYKPKHLNFPRPKSTQKKIIIWVMEA